MYAIIKSGSRQYEVRPQGTISVFRLNLEAGAEFETEQVLFLEDDKLEVRVGAPYVPGAKVKGTVLEHFRDKKILVFKQKRRKGYRRTRGHRQEMTRIRIETIEAGQRKSAKEQEDGS